MKKLTGVSLIICSTLVFSTTALASVDGQLCRIIMKAENDASLWMQEQTEKTNRALGMDSETKDIRISDDVWVEFAKDLENEVAVQGATKKEEFEKAVNKEFNYDVVVGRAQAIALVKNLLGPGPAEKSPFAKGNSDLQQNYFRYVSVPFMGASIIIRSLSSHFHSETLRVLEYENWAKSIIAENDKILESELNSNKKIKRSVLKALIKSYDCTSRSCSIELNRLQPKLKEYARRLNRDFLKYSAMEKTMSEFLNILRNPRTEDEKRLAQTYLAETERQFAAFTQELNMLTNHVAQNQIDLRKINRVEIIRTLLAKHILVETYLYDSEPGFLEKLVARLRAKFIKENDKPK